MVTSRSSSCRPVSASASLPTRWGRCARSSSIRVARSWPRSTSRRAWCGCVDHERRRSRRSGRSASVRASRVPGSRGGRAGSTSPPTRRDSLSLAGQRGRSRYRGRVDRAGSARWRVRLGPHHEGDRRRRPTAWSTSRFGSATDNCQVQDRAALAGTVAVPRARAARRRLALLSAVDARAATWTAKRFATGLRNAEAIGDRSGDRPPLGGHAGPRSTQPRLGVARLDCPPISRPKCSNSWSRTATMAGPIARANWTR